MPLDIMQQEIFTGSKNIRAHSCNSPLSPPAPYLETPYLSLRKIGCKHISSYFAFPIVIILNGAPYLQMSLVGYSLIRY